MNNIARQHKLDNRSRRRTADTAPEDTSIVRAHLIATVIQPVILQHPARELLVREAAYHHAEARGFEPGHELEDWLMAEAEVDARLWGEGRAY